MQQRRPRELELLANRDDNEGENLLGGEGHSRLEPPYGSPDGTYSVHDGMIRDAVEDVLAENELLRRRISDLENFSSVRTASTRQYQSTGSRSGEIRSPEPDYSALDQLAEADGFRRAINEQPPQRISTRHNQYNKPCLHSFIFSMYALYEKMIYLEDFFFIDRPQYKQILLSELLQQILARTTAAPVCSSYARRCHARQTAAANCTLLPQNKSENTRI